MTTSSASGLHWFEEIWRHSSPTLLNAASTILAAGLGFAYWAIVHRFQDYAIIGSAGSLIATATLAGIIGKLGLDVLLLRDLGDAKLPRRMLVRMSVVAAIGSLFLGALLAWPLRADAPEIVWSALLAATFGLGFIIDAACIGLARYGTVLVRTLLVGLIRIGSFGALLFLEVPSPILASWLIGNAIIALFVLALARQLPVHRPEGIEHAHDRTELILNYLTSSLVMAPGLVFPSILLARTTAETAGVFYFVWMIVALLHSFPNALGQALLGGARRERTANKWRMIGIASLFTAAALGLLMLLAPILLPIVGGRELLDAKGVILLFGLIAVAASVQVGSVAVLRARRQWWRLMWLSATFATISIGGAWALVGRLGLEGVVVAWGAAQAFMTIGALWASGMARREAPNV